MRQFVSYDIGQHGYVIKIIPHPTGFHSSFYYSVIATVVNDIKLNNVKFLLHGAILVMSYRKSRT